MSFTSCCDNNLIENAIRPLTLGRKNWLFCGEITEENGVQARTVEYIVRNFASELPEIPTMRKKKKDASEEDYDRLRVAF